MCLALPAISAVAEGYKVFAVIDASGTYSKMAEEVSTARMLQAGVIPIDTAAVIAELQHTWNRKDADVWAEEVWPKIFVNYRLLLESYAKTKSVIENKEILDSERK